MGLAVLAVLKTILNNAAKTVYDDVLRLSVMYLIGGRLIITGCDDRRCGLFYDTLLTNGNCSQHAATPRLACTVLLTAVMPARSPRHQQRPL